MKNEYNALTKKIKALRGIDQILQTWLNVVDIMTPEERSHYRLMLESAQSFMHQQNFDRVNREYRLIQEMLRNIQSRREDAA